MTVLKDRLEWQRYWFPAGKAPNMDTDYLANQQDKAQGQILETTALSTLAGVGLLAEPGMGKTTELTVLYEHLLQEGVMVIHQDLSELGNSGQLRVFLNSVPMTSWLNDVTRTGDVLLLDSLDHLLGTDPSVVATLSQELGRLLGQAEFTIHEFTKLIDSSPGSGRLVEPFVQRIGEQVTVDVFALSRLSALYEKVDEAVRDSFKNHLRAKRLKVYISCRAAQWPKTLQDTLSAVLPGWQLRELAPLRRDDVRLAADHRGLDSQVIVDSIDRLGLSPLASRPITLMLLMGSDLQSSKPPTQVSLYQSGCQRLCEELNELRLDTGMVGDLTSLQRLAIAERIAAMSVLGSRIDITTRSDMPNQSETLTLNDIIGGIEGRHASEVQVTAQATRETLFTALFTSSQPGRMRWIHQTYAEYLTARYLLNAKLSKKKLLSLLQQPGDVHGKIALPLREVGAWIAAIRPEIGDWIRQHDPAALISAAAIPGSDEHRALILESYLSLEANEGIPYGRDEQLSFYRFTHPNLAEQLRSWLSKKQSIRVLFLIARIAVSARVTELWVDFIKLALDLKFPADIRPAFAEAACNLVPDNQIVALKVLLKSDLNGVRGHTLQRLWPDFLTPLELLSTLHKPIKPGIGDSYKHFLWMTSIWDLFSDSELPTLVNWLSDAQGGRWIFSGGNQLDIETRTIRQGILKRLWQSLEQDGVAQAFLSLVEEKLMSGRSVRVLDGETDLVRSDRDRRHLLIVVAADHPRVSRHPERLVYAERPWVLSEDAEWVLSNMASAVKDRPYWLGLCKLLLHTDEMQQVLARYSTIPELQKEMERRIQLHSAPPDPWIEEQERQAERWRAERDARSTYDVEICDALGAISAGEFARWSAIPDLLHINERSQAVGHDMHHDIRKINGWSGLTDILRTKIITTATQFIINPPEDIDPYSEYGFASVRALRLLAEENPSVLRDLPNSVWVKWAPAVAAWPPINKTAMEADYLIWRLAYAHSPEEMIRVIKEEILAQRNNYSSSTIDMAECILDQRLEDAYLSLLDRSQLMPGLVEELLYTLLLRNSLPAQDKALKMMRMPITIHAKKYIQNNKNRLQLLKRESLKQLRSHPRQNQLAVAAARALLRQPEGIYWEAVFTRMQEDSLGEAILKQGPWIIGAEKLNEKQLVSLFTWAQEKFPKSLDPIQPVGIAYSPGIRDSIAGWRNGLISELTLRSTTEAMHALNVLQERHPDLTVELRRAYAKAVETYLARMWTPIEPAQLQELVNSGKKYLVRDARQLHELVLDSLEEMQQELQGANTAVQMLWDMPKDIAPRPKDENAFSDFVARYLRKNLKDRGVVLNREVEIHRRYSEDGVPGERLDIRVDAVAEKSRQSEYETVSVLIEVKGCWNSELDTAMEQQLIKRYMVREQLKEGIYLVAWFLSNLWDKKDTRYKQTKKISLDESRQKFDNQATALSTTYEINVSAMVVDTRLL